MAGAVRDSSSFYRLPRRKIKPGRPEGRPPYGFLPAELAGAAALRNPWRLRRLGLRRTPCGCSAARLFADLPFMTGIWEQNHHRR